MAGRIRFAVEAVSATVEAIGAHRVGLRLSPGAGIWDAVESEIPQLYTALLAELAPLGLAYIHLGASPDEDVLLELRRSWPGTLIVNPSATHGPIGATLDDAERWLARGADFISFGRAFLANPDLVERLRADHPLVTADESSYYAGGDNGYITYPVHTSPQAGLDTRLSA